MAQLIKRWTRPHRVLPSSPVQDVAAWIDSLSLTMLFAYFQHMISDLCVTVHSFGTIHRHKAPFDVELIAQTGELHCDKNLKFLWLDFVTKTKIGCAVLVTQIVIGRHNYRCFTTCNHVFLVDVCLGISYSIWHPIRNMGTACRALGSSIWCRNQSVSRRGAHARRTLRAWICKTNSTCHMFRTCALWYLSKGGFQVMSDVVSLEYLFRVCIFVSAPLTRSPFQFHSRYWLANLQRGIWLW